MKRRSIPRDAEPRYLLDSKTDIRELCWFLVLVIISIGMLSIPIQQGAHADSNVNMSSDQFNAGYQNAQNNHWFTGNWGTAQFYIAGNDMYVSGGQLQGNLANTVGLSQAYHLNSINFTQAVRAPQDSSWLLAGDDGNNDYNVPLHYINGLANLDTSQVTNMDAMFYNDASLTHLDGLQDWNTSRVNNMTFTFMNDNHLQNLDLSRWNVGQVNSMSSMFEGDASLSDLNNINDWDTHSTTDMSYMFMDDINLIHLGLDHWDTSHVNEMANMFSDTNGLQSLDIKDWDTSQVTDMSDMFHNFNGNGSMTDLDLSNWDTSHLQNGTNMFIDQSSLRDLKLNNFDTTHTNMSWSFLQDPGLAKMTIGNNTRLSNIQYIPGFGWQNSNQILSHDQLRDGNAHSGDWTRTSFADAYYDASQKGYWGTAPWYIDNGNNMHVGNGQLLGNLDNVIGNSNAHSIASVNFDGKVQAPQNSSWLLAASSGFGDNNTTLQAINGTQNIDTSQVTNMGDMFENDMGIQSLDLSNWDTSHVVDMNSIFDADQSLQSLNVSDWNVAKVQNLSWSFYLNSLSNLDLSGWHTNSVNDMEEMLDNDKSLQNLGLSNFDTFHVSNMTGMYDNDNLLSQISLGNRTQNTPSANTGLVSNNWQNGNQILDSTTLQNNDSHPGTWNTDAFMANFHQAQRDNQSTGFWGTAPWYIDGNNVMHVDTGHLQGDLYHAISPDNTSRIKSIDIEGRVQAPQDSSNLFSTDSSAVYNTSDLTTINGLNNLDTGQARNMQDMFYSDTALSNLDLSSWNTANVSNMLGMFTNDLSLQSLNMNDWNTSNVDNMYTMFANDTTLTDLNLSTFDTSHANTSNMFGGLWTASDDSLSSISLAERTHLYSGSGLPNVIWQNNATHLGSNQLTDGSSHPGTWQLDSFYQNAKNESNRGTWGTAPWYIDSNHNMHVGAGQLQGHLYDAIGSSNASQIQSINFDESIKAPQDSSFLLSTSNRGIMGPTNLQSINGLDKIDTSSVQSMNNIFSNDAKLTNLDLTSWDLNNVKDLSFAFWDNSSLSNLNISDWDTSNISDMNDMLDVTKSLYHLNLGNRTYLKAGSQTGLSVSKDNATSLTSGNQTVTPRQLEDGNAHPGDWKPSQFFIDYQNAQKQGWTTGFWGSAPYYIDNGMNMHVGDGQLQNPLFDVVGDNVAHNLKTINLDEPAQAPENGLDLFSGRNYHLGEDTDVNQSITAINGLDKLDVSDTSNFHDMFYRDTDLNSPMDIDGWDTRHVNDMGGMFGNTNIPSFDIHDWNVSNNTTTGWMFFNDYALQNLNLDNWHTDNLDDSTDTFSGDMNLKTLDVQNFKTGKYANSILFGMDGQIYTGPAHDLEQMTLGNETRFNERSSYFPGATWTNGKDLLSRYEMDDGNPHPGTWHLTQFAQDFRYAKQHGWQTGTWGNAPWYIDPGMNMHVGKGQLQGGLNSVIPNDRHQIQSINLDEPVQAPQDSTGLFAETTGFMDNDYTLHTVNGLNNLDTRQTTSMNAMFYNDTAINHLDISHWDTSHVQYFNSMFTSDNDLTDLRGLDNWNVAAGQNFSWTFYGVPWSVMDLHDWQTPHATDMEAMFENAGDLSDLDLSNLDTTHAKTTHMFGNDTSYHLPSDHIQQLVLGPKTTLNPDAGLTGGMWNSDHGFADTYQLMDDQAHPGTWNYSTVQDAHDISGTTDDDLSSLLHRDLHLADNTGNIQIINDQGSLDSHGHLRAGDYSNVTFVTMNAADQLTSYRTNMSIHHYTAGPDLRANVGQDIQTALGNTVQEATNDNSRNVHLDDDGGSTSDGTHLQYGTFPLKYHYQDNQQDWHYLVSDLHVDKNSVNDYLYVNPNTTTPSDDDYTNSVAQFLGISPTTIRLTGSLNGSEGYMAHDGDQDFMGDIKSVPGMNVSLTMSNIPGASDDIWHSIIEREFANDSAYGFNVTAGRPDSFTTDHSTGAAEIKGTVHAVDTQFANDPAIPYDFHINPPTVDYHIDNTVNDRQVQDVINTFSDNARVAKVMDGNGADVTGSFGELSTIPQDSHVTVTIDTGHGYVNLHFTHIGKLVEPNVDVTHDSATEGSDISNEDLQGQIMNQTHEGALDNFGVDNSQMVSPNVKEIDYRFTKDTVATGSSLDVKTADNQVTGTAYVHYTNDDTSDNPTFTVVQGSDPTQHIANVIGHPVQITQTPSGHDIDDLPVGSYDIAYQDTDENGLENDVNSHANITVVPNYYFSPVTNDPNFSGPGNEVGNFKSDDYQNDGNSYKSVVDTHDYSKDNRQDRSSDNPDSTVDGLHTQDGKAVHFDSNNPYNK